MFNVTSQLRPPLEPDFVPAVLWNRGYRALVARDPGARPFAFALHRPDGTTIVHRDRVLAAGHPAAAHTLRYAERLLKFLLWQKGASRVQVAGADELATALASIYSATGARAFDHAFMGRSVYRVGFSVAACALDALPAANDPVLPVDRSLEGCRIGFDLGGSERKVAASIDGRVVHSERLPWDPYFEPDPAYHVAKIAEALQRAAAHLPRVDAIGGSAAGIYVDNEVRVASMFRGVSADDFERHIRPLFLTLQQRWGGVPFRVINDGEVAALAGARMLEDGAVLGISMGTSQAAGYVSGDGCVTTWLNELAFAPINYRRGAARDEWSGDDGCGVQYFSRQVVHRLAARAGLDLSGDGTGEAGTPAAALDPVDRRTRAIFETIGVCFGYAVAHYAEFYEVRNLLLLGGVTAMPGGEFILRRAAEVLRAEFPELADRIRLHSPGEKDRSHGQAIAAASLPTISRPEILCRL